MRELLLLRHAKSSWDDPSLDDHDRPLARRGRRAADALRQHLSSHGVAPDLILCSTARRTVETWERIAPGMADATRIEIDHRLYGADAADLRARLHEVEPGARRVMVIAHNPGVQDLVLELVGTGDERQRARMERKYPTGALATLAVAGPWATIGAGVAELVDFVEPRRLPQPEPS
jgi:phosphohistidine phosphatase